MEEGGAGPHGPLSRDRIEQPGPPQTGAAIQDERGKKIESGGKQEDEQSALKEWIELLVRAGIWAILIYVFIFQVSMVEQDSMNPTIHDGDKLVIDKLTYRLSAIKRYDVIVFETIDTGQESSEHKLRIPKDYIKRVIGLPGEKIEIRDGGVWVQGQRLKDRFGPTRSDVQVFVVPPKHYFVMGDNRPYSKDSRCEIGLNGRKESLGFVPAGQIRGMVRLRFWPNWTWFGHE